MIKRLAQSIVAAVVLGLVGWRATTAAVDTYGDSGAGYIEHLERVRVLSRVSQTGPLLDRLRAADGLYPPGLHLLTAPASIAAGHTPESVAVVGVLWLVLLSAAVGLITRRLAPKAGSLAALATLLVPALHGVAPRYYYDLPMTALVWTAAAILVGPGHGAWRGVGAGLVFVLACGVKWSALPLGASVILAGLMLRDPKHHQRTAAVAGLVITGPLLALLLTQSTSFGSMGGATFQPPPGSALPDWAAQLDDLQPGLGHAVGSAWVQITTTGLDRAGFYASRTVTTVFSPALLPFFALGFSAWGRRGAPGLQAMLVAAVPVVVFVVLAVPPLDERFLLTVVPAVVVPAAIGLHTLGRARRTVQLAAALTGVAVAVDFHTGQPLRAGVELSPAQRGHMAPLRFGVSTSTDARGWARRSDLPDHRNSLRKSILGVVSACDARSITAADRLVQPTGDLNWWTFEVEREAFAGGPRRAYVPIGSGLGPLPSPPDLALLPDPTDAWGHPVRAPEGLVHTATLPATDGGPGVQVWRRAGAPDCGPL